MSFDPELIQEYLDILDGNVRSIEHDVKTLSYHSKGALTYPDALNLSPKERSEWIQLINDSNPSKSDSFRNE